MEIIKPLPVGTEVSNDFRGRRRDRSADREYVEAGNEAIEGVDRILLFLCVPVVLEIDAQSELRHRDHTDCVATLVV